MRKCILIFILAITIAIGTCPITTFGEGAEIDFSPTADWYVESSNDLYITCENDFLAFANLMQDHTYRGKAIHVTNDLDFTSWEGNYYETIEAARTFSGIIDGHGHTIKGLKFTSTTPTNYSGLLGGKIESGTVSEKYGGACAGVFDLAIVDCEISSENSYTGALFGAVMPCEGRIVFENVYVDATVESNKSYVGGFIGYNNADTIFSNCVFVGTVNALDGATAVGGFMGGNGITKVKTADLRIEHSAFYGMLSIAKSDDSYGVLIGTVGRSGGGCVTTTHFENVVAASASEINGVLSGQCHKDAEITYENVYSESTDTDWCGGGDGTFPKTEYSSVESASLKGMSAIIPSGFVAVPWGYAMPRGVVNFAREHTQRTAVTGASTEYVGFQTTDFADGFCNLRLIAVTSDGKEGKSLDGVFAVGFEVEMSVVIANEVRTWRNTDAGYPEVWTVFDSVVGKSNDDKTQRYTAESLGGDYVFVATVDGLKQNVGELIFTVRTFHDGENGARIYDDVYVISYDTGAAA